MDELSLNIGYSCCTTDHGLHGSCIVFLCAMTNAAQFLGAFSDSKLLMIHADDLGMCHSVNRAIIMALEHGTVNSASLMVPCPCFQEAAEWARQHPGYDIGIHSTLISEWESYRWGPVSRSEHGADLVDDKGYFWPRNSLLRASSETVHEEISAQIKLAKQSAIRMTLGAIRQQPLSPRAVSGNSRITFGLTGLPGTQSRISRRWRYDSCDVYKFEVAM